MEKKKPVQVFDRENVRASLFPVSFKKDGKEIRTLQISFGKRYKKDGKWRTSTVFEPRDIRKALYVLMRAETYLELSNYRSEQPIEETDQYYAEMQGDEWLEVI